MLHGEQCVRVWACVCVCVHLGYQDYEVIRGRDTHLSHMMSSLGSAAEPGLGLWEGSSYHSLLCSFMKTWRKCIITIAIKMLKPLAIRLMISAPLALPGDVDLLKEECRVLKEECQTLKEDNRRLSERLQLLQRQRTWWEVNDCSLISCASCISWKGDPLEH